MQPSRNLTILKRFCSAANSTSGSKVDLSASSKVVPSRRPLRMDRFAGDRDLDSPLFKPTGRRSEEEYEALRRSLGLPTLADRYIQ